MAEEIREYMAQLGYRSFEDMVGQVQHLEMNQDVLHYKSQVGAGDD
jgi:glutamate synthase (NADPH) large chain